MKCSGVCIINLVPASQESLCLWAAYFFHLAGVSLPAKYLKYIAMYISLGKLRFCPRTAYCSLTASPLSLHPLLSQISICLNQPVGSQGSSWRWNETYFLQRRNKGKDLYPGEPHRVLLGFPVFVEHVRHVSADINY